MNLYTFLRLANIDEKVRGALKEEARVVQALDYISDLDIPTFKTPQT